MTTRQIFRKAGAIARGVPEQKIKQLSYISNRRYEQMLMLYVLCGENMDVLMQLQAQIKKHFIYYTPADKREVMKILSL